jgi:hypothetical protein
MLLTHKAHLMQCLQQAYAVFLCDSVVNHQYKLPQKNENDYSELFISIFVHLCPINLYINCYCADKSIETIK